MGIKGIGTFIKQAAPGAFQPRGLEYFKHQAIAVDASNFIDTMAFSATRNVAELTDFYTSDVPPARVLHETISIVSNFCIKCVRNSVTPLFVFDGAAPAQKRAEQSRRRATQAAAREKLCGVVAKIREHKSRFVVPESDILQARALARQVRVLTPEHVGKIKAFLADIGVPVVQCHTEGERLCSMLCRENKVAAVWSADSDNWMYGSPVTLRVDRDAPGRFVAVDYPAILAGLGLTADEFHEFCILCGTDYNTNIPGIGPKKAYELIKAHHRIADIPPETFKARSKKFSGTACLEYETTKRLTSVCDATGLYDEGTIAGVDSQRVLTNQAALKEKYPEHDQVISTLCFLFREPRD